jgi:hypothetical protein
MKKIISAFFCFVSLQYVHAQISDSAVKVFSTSLCSCIDTVDLARPEAELKKAFTLCKTFSLVNLLNNNLITAELMSDEKQMADLQNRAFNLLANDCDAIKRLVAALNKIPEYREKNADNIFTPAAFFKTYDLKPGEANALLHVYNSEKNDDVKYQRLVDIRWTFEDEADALLWHQKKMAENSEGGDPVKEIILIQGAQELKIFREGSSTREMLKGFGLKQRHHYFLFVYKNIVCKVFVATDDKTETRELVPFAMAAIKQLKTVLQ